MTESQKYSTWITKTRNNFYHISGLSCKLGFLGISASLTKPHYMGSHPRKYYNTIISSMHCSCCYSFSHRKKKREELKRKNKSSRSLYGEKKRRLPNEMMFFFEVFFFCSRGNYSLKIDFSKSPKYSSDRQNRQKAHTTCVL